jgi:hypothetical protein
MAKASADTKRIIKPKRKLGRHKKHVNKSQSVKAYRGQGR